MSMIARYSRRLGAGTFGGLVALWVCAAPFGASIEAPSGLHAQVLDAADLWLAPTTDPVVASDLARGVALLSAGRAAEALPVFVRETGDAELGGYAHLYAGRAQHALGRDEQAMNSARLVIERTPGGALGEAALWLMADAAAAADKWPDAIRALQALTGLRIANPQQAYLRLAKSAELTRDLPAARGAFAKIYYDWPLSPEANDAADGLARLGGVTGPETSQFEMRRAEALYTGRRYGDARKAFQALRTTTTDETARWAIDLRIAQCDYFQQRYPAAAEALRTYIERAPGSHADAEYALLNTLRAQKRDAEYVQGVATFVEAHSSLALAETALNDLATYYILANDDARAADVFTRMYAAFPAGAFADRAAWKSGWWAYKNGNYRETIRLFESAAASMRRADYRPSWLYWAARSHEALSDRDGAIAGYRRVITDYSNSYYGREASRGIARLTGGRPTVLQASARREPVLAVSPGARPANTHLIRRLLEAGLYDDAIAEVRKVQLESGNAPILDATLAYALNRKGELRPAITAMRRAYPQFMAEGGEQLPRRILNVIFPVAHWDLIQRYASERRLDPFLVAALVAQESTFQADIKSAANAWGLMQIIPSTGRRYAPRVGVRPFTTAKLTDPDINVRIGTAYLADLIGQFDDVASALAAYNAGESRVSRWRAERPGISRDEFVDDIPFPETQNYVKRIIGTAEDYRFLYGSSRVAVVRQSDR